MDRLVNIRRKGKERRENKRAKIEREQRIKRGGGDRRERERKGGER